MENLEDISLTEALAARLHSTWRRMGSGLFTRAYRDPSDPSNNDVASVVLCQRTPDECAEPVYVGLRVNDSYGNINIHAFVKGPEEDLLRWRRALPAIGGEWHAFRAEDGQACAMAELFEKLPPASDRGYTEHEGEIRHAVRTLCDYVSGAIRVDYRLFSPIVAAANQQPLRIRPAY